MNKTRAPSCLADSSFARAFGKSASRHARSHTEPTEVLRTRCAAKYHLASLPKTLPPRVRHPAAHSFFNDETPLSPRATFASERRYTAPQAIRLGNINVRERRATIMMSKTNMLATARRRRAKQYLCGQEHAHAKDSTQDSAPKLDTDDLSSRQPPGSRLAAQISNFLARHCLYSSIWECSFRNLCRKIFCEASSLAIAISPGLSAAWLSRCASKEAPAVPVAARGGSAMMFTVGNGLSPRFLFQHA